MVPTKFSSFFKSAWQPCMVFWLIKQKLLKGILFGLG